MKFRPLALLTIYNIYNILYIQYNIQNLPKRLILTKMKGKSTDKPC